MPRDLVWAALLALFHGTPAHTAGPAPQKSCHVTCQEWRQAVAGLSKDDRATLKQTGALLTGDWVLLDERVVQDCATRAELSAFLYETLGLDRVPSLAECPTLKDKGSDYVAALRVLWPFKKSGVLANVVERSERYRMLKVAGVADSLREPVLREVLESEGLSSDMTDVLLAVPIRSLRPDVEKLFRLAWGEKNVVQTINGLVILHAMGDPDVITRLGDVLRGWDLSATERKVVHGVAEKISAGGTIVPDDLVELEYGE